MKWTLPILAAVAVGCASVQQEAQTKTSAGETNRITKINVKTLFDSKQVIASLKASNGQTHSLGAAGVDQESSSRVLQAMVESAVTAAVKAVVPVPTVPAK